MSQVKKLQAGGKFIIDGQEINGTDAINAVRSNLGETTGGIMKALQDGATVNYNSADNTIRITSANGVIQTLDYLPAGKKASTQDSDAKKTWDATWNTKANRFKKDLQRLRNVIVNTNSVIETKPILPGLRRGQGWFAYHKNDDGTLTWLNDHQGNADKLSILKDIEDYVNGNDEYRKGFSLDKWGNNFAEFENYYRTLVGDDKTNYWTNLIERIKTNNLSESDIYTLKSFGFNPDGTADTTPVTLSDRNENGNYTIANGWNGDKTALTQAGLGIRKRDDDRWELIGDENSPYLTSNWWTNGLDFLPEDMQRGFLLNGAWYSEDEVKANPELYRPYVGKWYSNAATNWNDWYNNANNSDIRFVNDRIWDNGGADYYGVFSQSFNPDLYYNEYLTPYFDQLGLTGNISVANVSNQFNDLPEGGMVFSYLDPTKAFTPNRGVPTESYVYYNPSLPEGERYTNIDSLIRNPWGGSVGEISITPYEQGFTNETGLYRDYSNYALYKQVGTGEGNQNSIYRDRQGNFFLGLKNQTSGKLKLQPIFNKELLTKVLANPTAPEWNNETWKSLIDVRFDPARQMYMNGAPVANDESVSKVLRANTRLRKQGGKLSKLQFGGAVKNTSTNTKVEDTSGAKTGMAESHVVFKDQLTDAEKLKIASAFGDAGGVGLSFIPGIGNVAGAATGAVASLTRFAADIKQDSLDRKDVGRLIGNLALDTASLIPGLGTISKGGKAIRAIKTAAPEIMKLLSIAGVASAIPAVKNIAEGKGTSDDVAKTIQALGSAAVAKHFMRATKGDAKLAVKAEEAKVGNIANELKQIKTAKIKDKEYSETVEKIGELLKGKKTKVEAVDAIKEKYSLTGKEADTNAEQILKDWGVTFKEGRPKLISKKQELAKFDTPKTGKTHSEWYFRWNPFARNRVLNKAQFRLEQVAAAKRMMENNNNTLLSDAVLRASVNRPKMFGFEPSSVIRKNIGWTLGGNRYYRLPRLRYETPTFNTQEGVVMPLMTNANPWKPKYSSPTSIDKSIVIPTEIPMITNTDTIGLLPVPSLSSISSFKLPNTFKPWYAPNGYATLIRSSLFDTNPTGISFQKYGGKIVKAQLGTKTKSNEEYLKSLFKFTPSAISIPVVGYYTEDISKLPKTTPGNTTPVTTTKSVIPDIEQLLKDTEDIRSIDPLRSKAYGLDSITTTITNPNTNNTTTYYGPSIHDTWVNNGYKAPNILSVKIEQDPGGYNGDGLKINYPNLDDAIRAGITVAGIYKDRDLQRKALGELFKRQFQTPQADLARYNFADIEQGYNETIKPYLDSRYVTSDTRDALAFNLSKAQQLSGLAGQKNAQFTQRKNQVDELNRQISGQNEAARIQTTNEKSQYLTGLRYQDKMLDSVALNRLFADVINPFGNQMSQQGRDAWNKANQMQYQIDVNAANGEEQTRINREFQAKYGAQYANLSTNEKAQFASLADYVAYVDPAYYKQIMTPSQQYREAMEQITKAYNRTMGASIISRKSGGSVTIKNSNKNLRPAQEQIAINSAKAAKRSVDELSKALLKMLAQLTK